MIKTVFAALAALFVASLVYAATAPLASAVPAVAPAATAPAPVVSEPAPIVLETSAVLVLAKPAPAKVARIAPKAPKAKTYQCGAWEESQVGGAFKRCEWR